MPERASIFFGVSEADLGQRLGTLADLVTTCQANQPIIGAT